jgi:ATP-binding cassette subfamily B protein
MHILFHETIAENLRYAKQDATEEEMMQACKSAQIWGSD